MGVIELPPAIWELVWVLAISTVLGGLVALYAVISAMKLVGKAGDAVAYWLKDCRLWRRRRRERWPEDKVARLKLIKAMCK